MVNKQMLGISMSNASCFHLQELLPMKFMVGYELLAEVQRDITPERAAESLRRLVIT
jgi:galactose-1-phosphate uridylyltransferase